MNLLFVGAGVAGTRVYARELMRGLARMDDGNEYIVFTRQDTAFPDDIGKRFHQVRAPVSATSNLWRTYWEYVRLPGEVQRYRCDLLHGLGNISSRAKEVRFVLTIHDMHNWLSPQSYPPGHRCFMRWLQPLLARKAARVIVPSLASADSVCSLLRVPRQRVRIIQYGAGNRFQAIVDRRRTLSVLNGLKVRQPFILSVARGYIHKNLPGLARAFAQLRKLVPGNYQLVLVGEPYQAEAELPQLVKALGLQQSVVFTGFIGNDDLNAVYNAAALFAFPSLLEGFGLPVIEAMSCGTPVVASNASAIPEAVGDAGVLADARDPSAFARAMAEVLRNDSLRTHLREKGLARARLFTWDRCARETLAVYREIA